MITKHLEAHLGTIARGWSDENHHQTPSVVRFDNVPEKQVATFSTLGLSAHILKMRDAREVREEFILAVRQPIPQEQILLFIFAAADGLLTDHRALLRGELIGDGTPIVPGSSCSYAYSAIPTLFADTFHVDESTTPPTVMVWLIPITAQEATYVKVSGWDAFETLLEERQPDLFDLARGSIV